jgi:hypothetical protein
MDSTRFTSITKHMRTGILIICILLFSVLKNYSIEIYVSPGGEGKELGTSANPYHSIAAALEAAESFAGMEPVNILLGDGVYYLENTLSLKPEISGTVEYPFIIKAMNEGQAIISGGQHLELTWKAHKDGIHVSHVDGMLAIDQLFIDSKREEMARYPNSQPEKNVYDCWDLNHGQEADPDNDALSENRIAGWSNPEGAYLHAMHRALWGDMHWLITGKDSDGKLVMEGGWQNNRPSPMHPRYRYIENVFEELDVPGEWYYDKKGSRLYYYPHPGADLENAMVEIVRLPHLIEMNGTKEEPVQHVHIEGLVFRHAARVFMDNREPLLRSDWTVYRGGAITFNGAEHCTIRNCEFDQLGGNSIFVNNYNRHISITGCYIHESGANGIAFVGDPESVRSPIFRYGPQNYSKIDLTPGPKSDNYPADCSVSDCIIASTGRTEKQTSPVQISMSFRITITHCSIYDVPRAGVNISEGTFGGHVLEYCDIFNTVLETGDHGSFNSWGRDRFWDPDVEEMNRQVAKNPDLPSLDMVEPNIIGHNRIRCDHGWDIDLDDGSSDYRVYNNLLLNGGIKLREGYGRIVSNNIVLNNGLHPHVWPGRNGDVFRHNIVFAAHRPALMTRDIEPDGKWGKEIDYNVYASGNQDRTKFAKNQCDLNSIVADPGFVDPAKGDFRVKEGSKALAIGFTNFDMTSFGVERPALRKIAKTPDLPEIFINPAEMISDPPEKGSVFWMGATLHEPEGEKMSAYGLDYNHKGVAMVTVPEKSIAWKKGFRQGDYITGIDDQMVEGIENFLQIADGKYAPGSSIIHLYRNQDKIEVKVYW